MTFTLVLSSSLPPERVRGAIAEASAAWLPSRLPEEMRGLGIYALVAGASSSRFVLGLRSQRYPAPLLPTFRGVLVPGPDASTQVMVRVTLPHYRVWLQLALACLGVWAGHITWLGYFVGAMAFLRALRYHAQIGQVSAETPSVRYLLTELGQLLDPAGPAPGPSAVPQHVG